jgi:hypothetical protein
MKNKTKKCMETREKTADRLSLELYERFKNSLSKQLRTRAGLFFIFMTFAHTNVEKIWHLRGKKHEEFFILDSEDFVVKFLPPTATAFD